MSIEEKALKLLSNGLSSVATSKALGVTESRISQLMANEEFSSKVATARYEKAQGDSLRVDTYKEVEDLLLGKLKDALPMMFRPVEILAAIKVINAATKSAPLFEASVDSTIAVGAVMIPAALTYAFPIQTNSHNQIVQVSDTDLVTIQSSTFHKGVTGDDSTNRKALEQ